MDEKQVKSRNILLGYLGGNEEKFDRYLSQLAICHKPYVSRPCHPSNLRQ